MEHLIVPLSDQEEAILQLLLTIAKLETENASLKEQIKLLRWQMEEHD